MSMRVFCGPLQPSLEDAFVERVRELAGARSAFAVVAPSRRMAERLQRLLAAERGLSVMGVRFHTFYSLALEVVDEDGGLEDDLVADGLFHDKIVDGVLAQAFRGRVSTRGLAGAYRSSIRDLADCGFSPALYREELAGLLKDGPEKTRLEEVLKVQEGYLHRLADAGILPPSGLTRAAAEIVSRGGALERYDELLYYGFYDLTGAQTDFFTAVAGARPVRVYFPFVKDHPGYLFARRFYDEALHGAGADPVHLDPRDGTRALGPVLDALSRPGRSAALASDERLSVISASGAGDEAWAVAKEILRLRAGKDPPRFDEIGIVARTLEPYRSILSAVLRENAIPFSSGAGDPLLRHPIAKLCLSLLQLGRRDFPARDLLDIVESRYFRGERFRGGTGWRALRSSWRRLVERVGVQGGWTQWEGMVGRWSREDLELYPRLVSEGLSGQAIAKEDTAQLWGLLQGFEQRLRRGGEASWKESAAKARALLEENFEVGERAPGAAAWAAVLAALDGLSDFDRALGKVSWDAFLDAFEEKLRGATLDPEAECRGVRVFDAMDARGESFRVLFVLGLQEGCFPRQVREDPLLPDGVRRALRDAAGYRIQPKLSGYDEERLLFHLLATAASERLYCVHQRSDEDGKALVPSLYLRELCAAAGLDFEASAARRVSRQPLVKLRELAGEDGALLSPKEASLLLANRGLPEGGLFAPLSAFVPSFAHPGLYRGGLEVVRELNRAGEPGAHDGIIRPPKDFMAKVDAKGLSPSALSEFRACPFKVFASRLLGLKEAETPSSSGELDAREKGMLYHSILEDFYKRLDAEGFWKKSDKTDWRPELEARIREKLPNDGWRRLGVYPVLWRSLTERMRVHLARTLTEDMEYLRESGLRPRAFELPLCATVDGVKLMGKLDRLDWDAAGTRYRVVDYKSKFHQGRLSKLAADLTQVQAPLYLELAEHADSALPDSARAVGADIIAIEDSKSTTKHECIQSFTREQWEELRPAVLEGVRRLRGMMSEGKFFVTPDEGQGKVCEYCSFAGLCRKSHGMTAARAESSRLRAEFEELREGR